ncbi:hypothetical protein [Streptosporangium sp. NPDC087985]|uniref:hypothetical protein n=1 Tax=Streptosporangium sp. NPDC087985 TaxID=3366196 RepID=UPI00380CE21D
MKHNIEIRDDRWIGVGSLLIICLRALDARIFAELDAFMWVQEWETDRGRLFRRTYRDPRFGTLLECGLCHGEDTTGRREPCSLCDGTGRIDWLRSEVHDEP